MYHSKNTSRADNQQERLIGWIVGFVDGEGCFSIGFVKQADRQEKNRIRRGYTTGYQVFPKFAVTQGAKSLASLEILKEYFGVGSIYLNKRHDNHKEHLYNYYVLRRHDLINVIIPFFRSYPLRTAKNEDFKKFATVVEMLERNEHRTKDGLVNIARIVSTMNRQKPRESLIRILRDQTPLSA
jgi:hypothetical protein